MREIEKSIGRRLQSGAPHGDTVWTDTIGHKMIVSRSGWAHHPDEITLISPEGEVMDWWADLPDQDQPVVSDNRTVVGMPTRWQLAWGHRPHFAK